MSNPTKKLDEGSGSSGLYFLASEEKAITQIQLKLVIGRSSY